MFQCTPRNGSPRISIPTARRPMATAHSMDIMLVPPSPSARKFGVGTPCRSSSALVYEVIVALPKEHAQCTEVMQ